MKSHQEQVNMKSRGESSQTTHSEFSIAQLCDCLSSGCKRLINLAPQDPEVHQELRNSDITSDGNHTERFNNPNNITQAIEVNRQTGIQLPTVGQSQSTLSNQSNLAKNKLRNRPAQRSNISSRIEDLLKLLGIKNNQQNGSGSQIGQFNAKSLKDQPGSILAKAAAIGLTQQVDRPNQWVDKDEMKEIQLRRQAIQQQSHSAEGQKYIFKSLLRQDYFNQRFQYKELPNDKQRQDCMREVQNFILFSQFLQKPETITYCEEISNDRGQFLLKYMPYQCNQCKRYCSEILICQCSTQNAELESCNCSVCLGCALDYYDYMITESTDKPVQECGFCQRSLVIGEYTVQGDSTQGLQLLPQNSRFSNIEELDAENDPESDTQEDGAQVNDQKIHKINKGNQGSSYNNRDSSKNIVSSNKKNSMIFDEANMEEESVSQIPSEIPNKRYELDNLVFRDATEEEKDELRQIAEENVRIAIHENNQPQPEYGRCSLIQMTPRNGNDDSDNFTDRDNDGYDSQRSQLTGLKPKALQFHSPAKSPLKNNNDNKKLFSTASTKERTASAGLAGASASSNFQKGFGLQNCMFQCEANENEGSPQVNKFELDNGDRLKNNQDDKLEHFGAGQDDKETSREDQQQDTQ